MLKNAAFKYKAYVNLNKENYKKYQELLREDGEIIVSNNTVLIGKNNAGKVLIDSKKDIEIASSKDDEDKVLRLILSMLSKVQVDEVWELDLTKLVYDLLEVLKKDKDIKTTDKRLCWPIRKMITENLMIHSKERFNVLDVNDLDDNALCVNDLDDDTLDINDLYINDFLNLQSKEEYDIAYSFIMRRFLRLAYKIADILKIKLFSEKEMKNLSKKSLEELHDMINHVDYVFTYQGYVFRDVKALTFLLKDTDCEDEEYEYIDDDCKLGIEDYKDKVAEINSLTIQKDRLKRCVKIYNRCFNSYNIYLQVLDEVNENDYQELYNKERARLIELFQEMFRYKNITYQEDWTYQEYLQNLSPYYAAYYDVFKNLFSISRKIIYTTVYDEELFPIYLNDIECLIMLREYYQDLKDGYQEVATQYEDVILEKDENYRDVINQEQKKLCQLFKEMLDFKKVPYSQDKIDDLEYMNVLVMKNYLMFEDSLISVEHFGLDESYVVIINRLRNIYKFLKENYMQRVNKDEF